MFLNIPADEWRKTVQWAVRHHYLQFKGNHDLSAAGFLPREHHKKHQPRTKKPCATPPSP